MATSMIDESSSVKENIKEKKEEIEEVELPNNSEEITDYSVGDAKLLQQEIAAGSSMDFENGIETKSEPCFNLNPITVSLHSNFNMQPELGGSTPGMSISNKAKAESEEEIVHAEDDPIFDVRIPKRKRVKEKSLLHYHAFSAMMAE